MTIYFWTSVLVLAALLFYPVSKLVWVLSVRRLQRKLGRELDGVEIQGQRQRAWVVAAFVVLIFSWLYNFSRIGPPGGG